MTITALVNGTADTHSLISNRGLAYGDGLFETVAILNGRLRFWDSHIGRLLDGCARLEIPTPNPTELLDDAERLISGTPRPDVLRGVLKIIVTRGSGGRGYTPPQDSESTRILQLFDWPESYERWHTNGIKIGVCTTRLSRNQQLAGMKHLNRLEQVLGAQECARQAWDEGLMFDTDGNLVCGTKTNVFLKFGQTIKTPRISHSGVMGVMRSKVLDECGPAGIEIEQAELTRETLLLADGLFITNAIMGVVPVARVDLPDAPTPVHREFTDFSVSKRLQKLINI